MSDDDLEVKPFNTDETETPLELFEVLNQTKRFCIDIFTNGKNSLVPGSFFTPTTDAMANEWPRLKKTELDDPYALFGWCWANPPYSRGWLGRFVEKCIEQAKRGSGIVALIPATPGAGWFNEGILRRCDVLDGFRVDKGPLVKGYALSMQGMGYRQEVMFLAGRVAFNPPQGWPADEKWSSPARDSILWTLEPRR